MRMKIIALCILIAYGNPDRTPIYRAAKHEKERTK